jgi:hypothetical protein
VQEHLPDARVTFDKFHVVAHASKALDGVRREQQRSDPALKGVRWSLLKDAGKLNLAQLTDLEVLISQYMTNRTARAWMYREQLREILDRKQIHAVSKVSVSVTRSGWKVVRDEHCWVRSGRGGGRQGFLGLRMSGLDHANSASPRPRLESACRRSTERSVPGAPPRRVLSTEPRRRFQPDTGLHERVR